MFTRQKKNYRIFIYVALIIALCILAVALVWPKTAEPVDNEKVVNNETVNTEKDDKSNIEDEKQESVLEEEQSTYYVVKKKGDKISVFFCDERGEEIELETTDIVYDLLTPEDQKSFEEGIKADSQEQLSSILQDFES